MEVVIRNMTIESPCMGWIPIQFDANRGLNLSEYRFLLTCRSDRAALQYRYFLSRRDTRLSLAEPNRPVGSVNDQRLPPAIHFSVYLRITKAAFHRHRHSHADMPIARTGINIGLQVARQRHIHTTVPSTNIPRRVHP